MAMTVLPGSSGSSSASRVPREHVLHVHVPVAAERLPGLPVNRSRQRGRPSVEHQRPGPVLVEKMAGGHRVGRVSDDAREAAADLAAQFRQAAPVAGNAHDPRAGPGQRDGDAAAEPAARAGHQCRRSGELLRCHVALPAVSRWLFTPY
jgi:hypothetical protein